MKLKKIRFGFIGAGNMAGAIIKGMLASKAVSAKSVLVSDVKKNTLLNLSKRLGVKPILKNANLMKEADVLIIAVKPQDIKIVLEDIERDVKSSHIIISIAAGVSIKTLRKYLKQAHIVRAMPNLGCFINQSATAISYSKNESKSVKDISKALFSLIGIVSVVSEKQMDIVTALSGSGPAYVAYLSQALISSAHKAGLDKTKAKLLFNHTLLASSLFLEQNVLDAKGLVQRVTSKGGTTEAALSVLKKNKVEKIFAAALQAAIKRSKELSK
ncbi:MAG: pyrroline-5-carboxylate reductase [Candidatus Kappaea frigidicola]|nr:pyrroline-5-carboxylate reductase [Candidatus Kappaea frigidicola]